MRNLVNFALFQAGWFACVLAAADGMLWAPLAATAAILVLHFAFVTGDRARESRLVVALALGGPLVSAFNVAVGAVDFAPGLVEVAGVPLWIVCMWALFATLLRHSLAWLRGRLVVAALCGLVGSPLSYSAAEGFGAVELHEAFWRGPFMVGITWAAAVPGAVWSAERDRSGIA